MALIALDRHTAADLAAWRRASARDALHGRRIDRKIAAATETIRAFFAADRTGYVGVSWGKDSVVVAHLAVTAGVDVPLVWINPRPVANPHCAMVRDAFMAGVSARYVEIDAWCTPDGAGGWHATGSIERGFAEASAQFGDRHVSGIRASESSGRELRMRRHGSTTVRTCAPIGWWSAADVFGYLARFNLPIHPVYAMTRGGLYERERLRVASLGGKRGTGHGRREWELLYYGAEMAAIGEASRTPW